MRRALCLLAFGLFTAAAGPPAPPDWPCVQRFVPKLAAASLWPGFVASADWRSDPALVDLVSRAADPHVSTDDVVAMLKAFIAAHPGPEVRTELFTGLVEQSNAGRDDVVAKLAEMNRRLRALADTYGGLGTALSAMPADAPESERDEVTRQRQLVIREYTSLNRTVGSVCERVPAFEARLGKYVRILNPSE